MNILIICLDNELPIIRQALGEEFHIIQTEDPHKAFAVVREEKPDAILCVSCVEMPLWQIVKEIRVEQDTWFIPVIVPLKEAKANNNTPLRWFQPFGPDAWFDDQTLDTEDGAEMLRTAIHTAITNARRTQQMRETRRNVKPEAGSRCMMQERPCTILVVEDDMSIREFMVKWFILFYFPSGIRFLSASNGNDGIQMAIEHKPDIIITDDNMPGLHGMELIKKVQELPHINTTIIAFGAMPLDTWFYNGNHVLHGFIPKPFYSKTLVRTVAYCAERMGAITDTLAESVHKRLTEEDLRKDLTLQMQSDAARTQFSDDFAPKSYQWFPKRTAQNNEHSPNILCIGDGIGTLECPLKERGYGLMKADSLREGIRIMLQQRVDLIITEILFPEYHAFSLFDTLKQHSLFIPIFFYTGYENPDAVRYARELGAMGYFMKHGNSKEILHAIRDLVGWAVRPEATRAESDSPKAIRRAVVLDDVDFIREDLVTMLESDMVYEAKYFHTGREGWECIQEQTPDIIFSEVYLHHIDGYEILTKIRTNPATQTMPFVFLTAKIYPHTLDKAIRLGADAFLTKPFTTDEILTTAEMLIDGKYKAQSWRYSIPSRMNLPRWYRDESSQPATKTLAVLHLNDHTINTLRDDAPLQKLETNVESALLAVDLVHLQECVRAALEAMFRFIAPKPTLVAKGWTERGEYVLQLNITVDFRNVPDGFRDDLFARTAQFGAVEHSEWRGEYFQDRDLDYAHTLTTTFHGSLEAASWLNYSHYLCEVTLRIPLASTPRQDLILAQKDLLIAQRNPNKALPALLAEQSPLSYPLRVVVAEEDEVLRNEICVALKKAGYHPFSAANYSQFQEAWLDSYPHFVLCSATINDKMFITKRQRNLPAEFNAIIVMGNEEESNALLASLKNDVAAVLQKPFTTEELLALLAHIKPCVLPLPKLFHLGNPMLSVPKWAEHCFFLLMEMMDNHAPERSWCLNPKDAEEHLRLFNEYFTKSLVFRQVRGMGKQTQIYLQEQQYIVDEQALAFKIEAKKWYYEEHDHDIPTNVTAEQAIVTMDKQFFQRMMYYLAEAIERHDIPNGTVEIQGHIRGGFYEIRFHLNAKVCARDTGFYGLDTGFGSLDMEIACAIVEAHGGTFTIETMNIPSTIEGLPQIVPQIVLVISLPLALQLTVRLP